MTPSPDVLSVVSIDELAALVADGLNYGQIGRRYGYGRTTIGRVCRKHIPHEQLNHRPKLRPGVKRCAACTIYESWEHPICGVWCFNCWLRKLHIWPLDFWHSDRYGGDWLRARCPELVVVI